VVVPSDAVTDWEFVVEVVPSALVVSVTLEMLLSGWNVSLIVDVAVLSITKYVQVYELNSGVEHSALS